MWTFTVKNIKNGNAALLRMLATQLGSGNLHLTSLDSFVLQNIFSFVMFCSLSQMIMSGDDNLCVYFHSFHRMFSVE